VQPEGAVVQAPVELQVKGAVQGRDEEQGAHEPLEQMGVLPLQLALEVQPGVVVVLQEPETQDMPAGH
jgi:hypothetical protein